MVQSFFGGEHFRHRRPRRFPALTSHQAMRFINEKPSAVLIDKSGAGIDWLNGQFFCRGAAFRWPWFVPKWACLGRAGG